jgi:type IX secretion system PorP/SprF family membrane protein
MKKSLLTFCVFISVSWGAVAQIDPLYAQYLNNPLLINPAYSGFQNNLSASTSFRKQWAGFDGSPVTINANAHTSLNDNRMGAGLIIVQDKIGSNKNTEVQATYAYKLDLNKKFFSFGLQAGVLNFKSTNSDLNIYDPNDPAFFGTLNTTKPSFGAGAILHSDRFFLGLSVPRLLNTQTVYNNAETQLYNRHFYAMGSYIIFIDEHIHR